MTVPSLSRQSGQETEQVKKPPYMERFSLHTFFSRLGPEELVHRNESTQLAAISRIMNGNSRAVLFSRPGTKAYRCAGTWPEVETLHEMPRDATNSANDRM